MFVRDGLKLEEKKPQKWLSKTVFVLNVFSESSDCSCFREDERVVANNSAKKTCKRTLKPKLPSKPFKTSFMLVIYEISWLHIATVNISVCGPLD